MKKKLLFSLAVLCVTCFFTSCEKNDDTPHKWAKTYGLSDYKLEKTTVNDYEMDRVVQGAGYVNYVCVNSDSDWGTSYGALFRGMFGVLLPQVLKTVTLEADGNITAQYIGTPNITFEPMWAFAAPAADVVNGLIPTSGWMKSQKGLATWSEKGGNMIVKLNIEQIIKQSGETDPDLIKMIKEILKSDAATLKALLSGITGSEVNISDESINMLLSWVNNGIPMTYKEVDNHVYIYLDKSSFDSLMKIRENNQSDMMVLWEVLGEAGIIPEEAQMAGAFINGISNNWKDATAFDLGLDLKLMNL